MQKKLFLIIILLILIAGLVFVFFRKPVSETETEPKVVEKKQTVMSLDELPLAEQPAIELTAISSCELKLAVSNLADFTVVEFELPYNTASGVRGAIGTVSLKSGQKSMTRNILLGSESSGKRSCDKGVTGGTLNLTFRGEKSYKYSRGFTLKISSGRATVVMEE